VGGDVHRAIEAEGVAEAAHVPVGVNEGAAAVHAVVSQIHGGEILEGHPLRRRPDERGRARRAEPLAEELPRLPLVRRLRALSDFLPAVVVGDPEDTPAPEDAPFTAGPAGGSGAVILPELVAAGFEARRIRRRWQRDRCGPATTLPRADASGERVAHDLGELRRGILGREVCHGAIAPSDAPGTRRAPCG